MNLRALLRQPVLTVAFREASVRWTLGSTRKIRTWGEALLPPGVVSDGVVIDPEQAASALRGCSNYEGNSRMQTVLALPAQRSVIRQIELPALKGKQFDELAAREIRREMPMLGENAYVSWARTDQRDGKASVFVIGVARDVLNSHVAAAQAAHLRPVSADLRIIAGARAFGAHDCVVAEVEEGETEIAIITDGVPAIVRHVGMAAAIGEDAWAEQLSEELNRTLKFYRDSHKTDDALGQLPISFVGRGAQRAVLMEQVRSRTGHDVALPPLRMEVDPPQEASRLAVNIGLACKDLAA
jgi:Tfp pilus assembly PilM family ATPase